MRSAHVWYGDKTGSGEVVCRGHQIHSDDLPCLPCLERSRDCNSRQFILKSSEEDLAARAPSPETRPAGGIQDRRLEMYQSDTGQVLE
jgi:hypothetical protein